ncbi:MFS transporter [Actinophytocola sp.]|uniref:MFS transporter n=1 Tax=Actinophytocola sp. TaxID=1872138 RepID=UPI002D7F31D3|nr:MFS transporter [Actinophytocola sp.]HET9143251.1 MFS transporter [Actinophytocola sp.]
MAAVLAVTEFRALWIAEAQSIAGDQLAKVALVILVYARTQSAWIAAAVYALTFLPALAGGLGLTQLADRFPRRSLMVACTLTQAVLVGLMAIPGMHIAVLCGLVVLVQLLQSPALAAQNAATREIFTDDGMYLRSQDIRGMTTNILMLVGLVGGGVLVVGIGPSWALAVDAVTFLASAVLIARYVRNRPVAGRGTDGWFDAAKWVFRDHRLRVLLTMAWLVGLVVVPEGLAAPLAVELGASNAAVGWLLAADPMGFVIGAFVLSRYVGPQARVRVMGVLAVGASAMLVLFALQPSLPAVLVLLAIAGALGAYQITVSATFNTLVPNAIRGGAIGVASTGLRVAQGVGVALGGAVATLIGSASATIAMAGALGVLIAVPAAVAWARIVARGLNTAPTPPDRPNPDRPNNGSVNGSAGAHPELPRVRLEPDTESRRAPQ